MKKLLSVILGLVLVLSLVACNSTSGKAKATLEAKVEEVHDESILVKDKEGMPYLVLSKVKDVKKGDTVKITYDGVVTESYPGQITNVYSIEKK